MNSFDICIHALFALIYYLNSHMHVMQELITKRRNYLWWLYALLLAKHSLEILLLSHQQKVGLPCYLLLSSLNRLVITDKEDAEYCSFETLILTHEMFWSSTVMLCTLHAIWQPFKKDIHHLLPSKKSQNGKLIELTEVGRAWGDYTLHIIVFLILYNETYLFFHDK